MTTPPRPTPPRVAIVTGAANGIGRACALRLATPDLHVAMVDVDEAGLAGVAAELTARGSSASTWYADCAAEHDVARTFAAIEAQHGPVRVLVNNVGQSAREGATEFWCSEPSTWRRVLDVSLISTMLWSRQAVPRMRADRDGRVVNMSSDAAFVGDAGIADYVAAKAGVVGFTRALARELAPFHVTVNAVAPGAIRTAAHDRLPAHVLERVVANIPMGFVGTPDDVAATVAFLASRDARYVTGQTWLVDGGRLLR